MLWYYVTFNEESEDSQLKQLLSSSLYLWYLLGYALRGRVTQKIMASSCGQSQPILCPLHPHTSTCCQVICLMWKVTNLLEHLTTFPMSHSLKHVAFIKFNKPPEQHLCRDLISCPETHYSHIQTLNDLSSVLWKMSCQYRSDGVPKLGKCVIHT